MRRSPLYTTLRISYNELSTILQNCTKHKALNVGKQLHGMFITNGIDLKIMSFDAKLLGLYASCGNLRYAHQLFDKMSQPNIFAINWMISAMSFHGCFHKALCYFGLVSKMGIWPNIYTFSMVLKACVGLLDLIKGSARIGRELHCLIYRFALEVNVYVASALIDMYSKCGDVSAARNVFEVAPVRNITVWNSMIGCLGKHGLVDESFRLFESMQELGFQPNEVTLSCMLSTCSHVGLVEKGMEIFECMEEKYHIHANKEHYACIMDLLCRAGKMEEAYEYLKSMPMEPTESIVGAFVNGCKIYQRRDLAKQMIDDVLKSNIKKAGAFVTLSNIFAADEEWQEVEDVRELMKGKGVYKRPGFSLVDDKYMSVALDIIKEKSNMDPFSEDLPMEDGDRLKEDFVTVQGCR